jgi:hypothetical protein
MTDAGTRNGYEVVTHDGLIHEFEGSEMWADTTDRGELLITRDAEGIGEEGRVLVAIFAPGSWKYIYESETDDDELETFVAKDTK